MINAVKSFGFFILFPHYKSIKWATNGEKVSTAAISNAEFCLHFRGAATCPFTQKSLLGKL